MRSLRLTWKDARGPGWTKRARWYEGRVGRADDLTIRIAFEDTLRAANRFYDNELDARHDFEMFEQGASVQDILKNGRGH